MSFHYRNCGISRYNTQYFCTIKDVQFINNECEVTIEVQGSGSMGPLQEPMSARVFVGIGTSHPIYPRSWIPFVDSPNFKSGKLIFDTSAFVANRSLFFVYGSSGYSKVKILTAIPNAFSKVVSVNSPGLSINLGGGVRINTSLGGSSLNLAPSVFNPPYPSYTINNPTHSPINNSYNPPMNNSYNIPTYNSQPPMINNPNPTNVYNSTYILKNN